MTRGFCQQIFIISVVVFAFIITFPGVAAAQALIWEIIHDPTPVYADRANSITADDNYIYIAGYDAGSGYQWRIEKRRKSDGGLEWVQTQDYSTGANRANSITADSNYLYIAGYESSTTGSHQWRIEKRRKSDGGLEWTMSSAFCSTYSMAYSITADDEYIYIAGYYTNAVPLQDCRIEKRRKSDGGLEWAKTPVTPSEIDIAYSIVANDNYLYIAGYDNNLGINWQWSVEKRRKSDGGLEWVKTTNPSSGADIAHAVIADDNYLYIAGYDRSIAPTDLQWIIQKRGKSDGGLVWSLPSNPSSASDIPYSMTADAGYIYIAGQGNNTGYIEKRGKSDGSLEWAQTCNPGRTAQSITEDASNLYTAGQASPSSQWWIEKRAKAAYIDIGLRIFNGAVVTIAAEPAGTLTSPLRIAKGGVTYGVVLVEPGDSNDSGVRIQTSSAIKALRKL